jgi:hypothetical protein
MNIVNALNTNISKTITTGDVDAKTRLRVCASEPITIAHRSHAQETVALNQRYLPS